MSPTDLDLQRALDRAVAAGALRAGTTAPPEGDSRPWPVVMLTAGGAWFSALPLLGFVGMLLGPLFRLGPGPYVVGLGLVALAVMVMRRADTALFVEQLMVPLLLVGLGSLGFALERDAGWRGGAVVMTLVLLAGGALVPRAWLRVLFGAAAAVSLWLALMGSPSMMAMSRSWPQVWVAWHGVMAASLLALWWPARPTALAAIEPMVSGAMLAVLAAFALMAGMTFLVGASTGAMGLQAMAGGPVLDTPAQRVGSVLLTLAALARLARAWTALRRPVAPAVALALAVLAWFMPTLGGTLLVGAACAATTRWHRAVAAAGAALWIVGAFYYALTWPLGTKALVLVAAGAVLGAVAWLWWRSTATAPASVEREITAAPRASAPGWPLGLAAAAVVVVASVAIWQKEQLIAQGRPAYLALAPVDPRSLMQGDFMALGYQMPFEVQQALQRVETSERPRIVASRDERGVLTLGRLLLPGESPGAGELVIELTPSGGRWVVVSDAWFFKEGEAERWQKAKYAEFRLMPDGRALLVGLRGENLAPL